MTARNVFFVLSLFAFWNGPLLWAQPALSGNPAPDQAAVPAPSAAQPAGVDAAAPENEEPPFMRDPFLTWIPPKVQELGESFDRGPREEGPEEILFEPGDYKVSGIVWGIEKAKAIINGKILGVGDTELDAEILKIDKEGVLLLFHEKEYLLARGVIDGKSSGEGTP